jgi:hypothetical protein
VSKPFDLVEVKTRIHNLVEVRLLYQRLAHQNKLLEAEVLERTAELRESEARYRSLTELATDWYWEQDSAGHFTKVSGPVLEMLGIRVDARFHLDQVKRFAHKVFGTGLQRTQLVARLGRDHQHRQIVVGVVGFQAFQHLKAVHHRHLQVQQDQVKRLAPVQRTHSSGVLRAADLGVAGCGQHLLKQEHVGRLVVHDKNAGVEQVLGGYRHAGSLVSAVPRSVWANASAWSSTSRNCVTLIGLVM